MSQKKVDAYKEKKANREKIMKKEKRTAALRSGVMALVLIAIIGWIGVSFYGRVQRSQSAEVTETVMDATAIDSYISGLQETTEE